MSIKAVSTYNSLSGRRISRNDIVYCGTVWCTYVDIKIKYFRIEIDAPKAHTLIIRLKLTLRISPISLQYTHTHTRTDTKLLCVDYLHVRNSRTRVIIKKFPPLNFPR